MKVGVVYLARLAEGISPIKNFLDSYLKYSSGIDHDLIIVYKGSNEEVLLDVKQYFSQTPHLTVEIDDQGFDIGAYIYVANKFDYQYFCFLNTFSIIESPQWLLKMMRVLTQQGVGMVAATGSFESLMRSFMWIDTVMLHYIYNKNTLDFRQARYVSFLLKYHFKDYLDSLKTNKIRPRNFQFLRRFVREEMMKFLKGKKGLIQKRLQFKYSPQGDQYWLTSFSNFPNIHLRSNAFAIENRLFRSFNFSIPKDKIQACQFESGENSISQKILEKGLNLCVVGADGESYLPLEWPTSGTFRSGSQVNLLVSDNQTRDYNALFSKQKIMLQYLTYGNNMFEKLPKDFPIYFSNSCLP